MTRNHDILDAAIKAMKVGDELICPPKSFDNLKGRLALYKRQESIPHLRNKPCEGVVLIRRTR